MPSSELSVILRIKLMNKNKSHYQVLDQKTLVIGASQQKVYY